MEQCSLHEDLEHVLKWVGSVSMQQKLNQLRTASDWVVFNSDKKNNSDTGQMRRRLAWVLEGGESRSFFAWGEASCESGTSISSWDAPAWLSHSSPSVQDASLYFWRVVLVGACIFVSSKFSLTTSKVSVYKWILAHLCHHVHAFLKISQTAN
jgi:hypothetical protein